MTIKHIIFDLGETVLTDDWNVNYHQLLQEFSDYYNISFDNMQKAWLSLWPKIKVGKINEDVFWKNFLTISESEKLNIEPAKMFWRDFQKPIENMLSLVVRIKENYQVSALANTAKEWFDFKRQKFDLDEYFDVIVASGHVGIAKPSPEIFQIILNRLNAKAEECLFIDNKEKCLLSARKMDMRTVLFTNQTELERKLLKVGINF